MAGTEGTPQLLQLLGSEAGSSSDDRSSWQGRLAHPCLPSGQASFDLLAQARAAVTEFPARPLKWSIPCLSGYLLWTPLPAPASPWMCRRAVRLGGVCVRSEQSGCHYIINYRIPWTPPSLSMTFSRRCSKTTSVWPGAAVGPWPRTLSRCVHRAPFPCPAR